MASFVRLVEGVEPGFMGGACQILQPDGTVTVPGGHGSSAPTPAFPWERWRPRRPAVYRGNTSSAPRLQPESHRRIDAEGASRREEAGEDRRGGDQEEHRQVDRRGNALGVVKEGSQPAAGGPGERHAEDQAGENGQQSLPQDEAEEVPPA